MIRVGKLEKIGSMCWQGASQRHDSLVSHIILLLLLEERPVAHVHLPSYCPTGASRLGLLIKHISKRQLLSSSQQECNCRHHNKVVRRREAPDLGHLLKHVAEPSFSNLNESINHYHGHQ